jgi:hypothetical protein
MLNIIEVVDKNVCVPKEQSEKKRSLFIKTTKRKNAIHINSLQNFLYSYK